MVKLISKEAAIDGVNQLVAGAGVSYPDDQVDVDDVIAMLRKMPVANIQSIVEKAEEKRTALWHWVPYTKPSGTLMYVMCDHCNKTNKVYVTDYCPHCGYRMTNKNLIKQQRHGGKLE